MSVSNIIEVAFGSSTLVFTEPYYKFNSGMYYKFTDLDLPESYQVHFSNSADGTSIESVGTSDGVLIPDDVWQSGATIYAWIYLHPTETSGLTKYEVRTPVSGRADLPEGVEPTPSEQTVIDEAITALNNAVTVTNANVAQTQADVSHYPTVVDGYWCVYDAESETWVSTGVKAEGTDGVGISSIAKTSTVGLVDTYTITFTDGTTTTYTVTNGQDGTNGRGITSIAKTSTVGLVDTYTITYTDGTTSTYTVTNGQDGEVTQAQLDAVNTDLTDLERDISALTGTLTATDITTPKGSTKVNILTIDLFEGNTITVTIKRDAELNVYTYFYIYDAEGNDLNPNGGSVASFRSTQTEISFQFTPNADYPSAQLLHTVSANASTSEHITEIIVEFSGEIGEIRGTAESTARRLNDIDTAESTAFESGGIGAQNTYVANSKQIRTPQGQAIPLSVGSTITIASGAKVYLRGIKENGTAYDGGTWKTGVYTVSTELNYLLIVSYDPEATVTDINALASMVTVRSVQTNPILKTQADVDEVYDMLGKNLAFYALKGTIDSVSGKNAGGMYPHIYSADSITYTKTAVYNYAGIEMRIDDFTIGNTVAVRADRDIETTAFMIRIDFYGEDGTRVAPEKTTTENVLKRVIPDGTSYIVITLPSNWGSALDVGTTVTYTDIDIYYSDIEDLRDEEGNTTYTGEKIILTNDNPKEHLCTVNQWLEYSETDLIEGLTTNKAFYKNQSMTIYGGYVFFFSENGGGFVADYSTKGILSEFSTEPTTVNHNNSAQFSDIYYADDDEFPLLFLSRCGNASYQSGEHDLDEMLIYRVVRTDTTFTFTLINTVKINVQTYGMSWGVDNVSHTLYAFAPINGNWQVPTGNYIDFWMFDEPTKSQILSGTPIVLDNENSVAHFRHDYFTGQGCAVNGGKLFFGVSSGKQWVWVADVLRGKILSKIPITDTAELEGVAIYNDKIYTTRKNSTNLYMFEVTP